MKKKGLSIRGMIYASVFGAVTAAGAYVMIPLPPVPITLQTLFLYLSAALLGGRLGALSQVIYLLVGIIGLPVFAGGKAGLGVLLGPTGGYLIGFVVGAYVIGKFVKTRKGPGVIWIAFAMIAGTCVIYLFGVLQLMVIAKLSVDKAVAVGVLPFLIGDALKIAAADFITVKLRGKVGNVD
ncbi:MAG: biotin transporter BioY [Deltaproteobacteria bacterium]|nr:biotin transporter BioY [Deltaproteobacteria bacterium]